MVDLHVSAIILAFNGGNDLTNMAGTAALSGLAAHLPNLFRPFVPLDNYPVPHLVANSAGSAILAHTLVGEGVYVGPTGPL